MVFDWFNRGAAGSAASEATPAAEPTPAAPSEEPSPASPETSAESTEAPAQEAPAAPAVGAVDEDALAWAREAYARLKAQQEASRQAAEPAAADHVSSEPVPTEPISAAAAPPPLPDAPAAVEAAPAPESPDAPPSPSPGPSLLEQAAALRSERLEQITGASALPPAEVTAAPAPPRPVAAPPPAVALPPEESEPSLGAFDDDFTWSAEVLAAQGRSVESMSLEEIDWLGRLRRGLEKTRRGLVTQLLERLGDDPLTPEVLDDLETTLLRADVGVQATDQVLEALRKRLNEEVVDPAEGLRFLKEQLRAILDQPIDSSGHALLAPQRQQLNVWLMVGVNGVGKTTTLG
ncbi:MAG: signal recognition particle receptor subunit alpha, partial [Cyanobium sp.]